MAEQIQRKSTRESVREETSNENVDSGFVAGGRLKEELDDLLDEIDAVLEVNAEDFIRGYVQKGGE